MFLFIMKESFRKTKFFAKKVFSSSSLGFVKKSRSFSKRPCQVESLYFIQLFLLLECSSLKTSEARRIETSEVVRCRKRLN